MRTPEEIRQLAEKFWVAEAFASEDALRTYCMVIVDNVHKLCQDWNFDGVEDWLAVFRYAEIRCHEEPLATAYEHGLMLITLSIAGTHAAMGSFAAMYVLAEQILELLRVQAERRAKLGLMALGNSQIRYHVCGNLARAKWRGAEEDRDRLLSVDEVAATFRSVADIVISHIRKNPDYDDGRIMEALAILGVQVAAMLFRWYYKVEPSQVKSFVSWYNEAIGESLSDEPGGYLTDIPQVDSAHYWSYELIKMYLAGCLTKDRLEYCHARRLEHALDILSKPRHLHGLYGSWEHERLSMLESIQGSDER